MANTYPRNNQAPSTTREQIESSAVKRGKLDPADATTKFAQNMTPGGSAVSRATTSAVSDDITKLNERTEASLADIASQAASQKALLGDMYNANEARATELESQIAASRAKLGELFDSIMAQIASQGQEADAAAAAAKASSDLLQAAQQRARIGDTASLQYDRTRGQATRTSTLLNFGFQPGSSRKNTFSNA